MIQPSKMRKLFMIFIPFYLFINSYVYAQNIKINEIELKMFHNIEAKDTSIWSVLPVSLYNFAVDSKERIAIWAYSDSIFLIEKNKVIKSYSFKYDLDAYIFFNNYDELLCIKKDSIAVINFASDKMIFYKNSSSMFLYSLIDSTYSELFERTALTRYSVDTLKLYYQKPDESYDYFYKLYKDEKNNYYSACDNILYKLSLKDGTLHDQYNSSNIKILNNFFICGSKIVYIDSDYNFIFYETNGELILEKFQSKTLDVVARNVFQNLGYKYSRNNRKIYYLYFNSKFNGNLKLKVISW
jgi:hypothetical protein